MPLIAPSSVGFLDGLKNMSISSQVSSATAVAMFVLTTAMAASAPAKYGSPPLKPFQPSHRMPAPVAHSSRLFGAPCSRSFFSRGPITAAATKPAVPADRWMT